MPETNNLLNVALRYYRLGWSVFPLRPGAKEPHTDLLPKKKEYPDLFPDLTPEEANQRTWKPFQRERASESQIRAWWAQDAQAGIGLVLGRGSGGACGPGL